jgi:hypothetical protein
MEVLPSLTVTWQVGEEYDDACTLKAPLPSVVEAMPPGLTVIG